MTGGGDHSTRPLQGHETRAGDALPTQAVLAAVKAQAWARATDKALGFGWPVGEAGLGVMRLAPAVALVALTKLCPQVPLWRAARCLGLGERDAAELMNRAQSLGPWAGEAAVAIFDHIRPPGGAETSGEA